MLCAFGAGLVYVNYPRFAYVLGVATLLLLYATIKLILRGMS